MKLEIFKSGKHTASDGRVFNFTDEQLKATAAAYDPAVHEAPIVVGHPKANAPAYGWGKAVSFADGKLQLDVDQVDPEFQELVKAGRFKKVSASFYAPEAPENPKPGTFYLRHVGFLGAQAPAVKGLKPAEFAADETGVINFMDWSQRDIASIFRNIRDWLIGEKGQEVADKVVPPYMVDSIQEDAVRDDTNDAVSGISYSERTNNVKTKEQIELERREAELKTQKEEQDRKAIEFAEREKAVKASEAAQRRVVLVSEVDVLVAAGKILPKDKAGLVAFMETLPAETTIEFGEGDKKEKKPSIDWLRGFLKTLPKAVEFSERGGRTGAEAEHSSDPLVQAAQLSRAALEFQETEKKAGRTVDIASAVAHVKAQAAQQ